MKKKIKNKFISLLGNTSYIHVLNYFLSNDKLIHKEDVVKTLKLSRTAVYQSFALLIKNNIIIKGKKEGIIHYNTIYYKLNKENPAVKKLIELKGVLKNGKK